MKVRLTSVFTIALMTSCVNSLSEYDKAFNYYVEKISPPTLADKNVRFLYFINLSSCSSCTEKHLKTMEKLSLRKDYKFLIVGDTTSYSSELKAIENKKIIFEGFWQASS